MEIESRSFDVSGLNLHARMVGQGAPVVLVHGYGVSGTYMLPLARELASSFTVFAPDLPGYGRSQRPPAPLGIADLAAALGGWLDAAGLECPAFVANSMGCQVVTELAVRRPERAGPLVLIGPTVDPQRRAARHQLLGGLREVWRESPKLVALAAHDDAVFGVSALRATLRSAIADRIEERLPLIEQPTLIVRGEQDVFVGQRWAEQVAALLPQGRLVVVPGQPHAAHYARPDLVATIVREFLVEEGEQARRQLPRSLPHGNVPAVEADEAGSGQHSLPLVGDPRGNEPVVLTPHEERSGVNRRELDAQVSVGYEQRSAKETEGSGPQRVAHDRR
jgi:pimeloyl-ACP methyl ester carboxylesterase